MSAVPKKKLCWNCDGNVSIAMDNCPYCGVYLQPEEERTFWNTSSSQKTQDLPAPVYKIHEPEEQVEEASLETEVEEEAPVSETLFSFAKIKQDTFAALFLMSGSLFFLFSVLLLLFSQDGKLTLEWSGDLWIYFLIVSTPLLYFGWKSLQKIET